jgi:H+/Cl- antiporter ClcA
METLKIVCLSVLAAVLYGVVHDQVTIRICPEYFTVFHPFLIATDSPTVLAAAWGVVATWWVGLPIGVLLALSARIGPRNKLDAKQVLPFVRGLLIVMACCALAAGIAGYFVGALPQDIAGTIEPAHHRRFLADWWAHSASYASGAFGGLLVCGLVVRKRWMQGAESRGSVSGAL